MIDLNTLALFKERYKSLTADGRGDNESANTRSLTLGMVVNTDDPLEQGRLQVFCPSLNDNPKKIQHLPWCAYITPFGGSINNKNYTRGTGDGTATSEGSIHYGFWGVPELGAHVLVGCIDGDPRRRFWAGCLPEHQETHTQFNGRYDWDSKDGTPDGPLTSSKKPIQPIYDNWTQAFVDRKSREWKTRGADYQPAAVTKAGNGAPSKLRGDDYLDDTYEGMSKNEKDAWVREVMGAHGYDWSGFKGAGAFKSSRVFGLSSPGFHSISMDDRPFNSRTKIRSSTGHMILMDDTNERIYIMTNKGNSWLEMDSNGNIDMFSERRVSINAAKDINMTTGGTFRVHADGGIHMYSGHSVDEYRGSLAVTPKRGEIRLQSEDDIHILSKNLRQRSIENTYTETGINHYASVGDSSFLDVTRDINVRTIVGDYVKSIANDLHETVMMNSKRLAYGSNALSSNGDNEIFSFAGGLSIGSQGTTSMKSASGDVNIEAQGKEGTGNVNLNTPKAQTAVGDKGIQNLTSESIVTTVGKDFSVEMNPASAASKTGQSMFGASGAAGPASFVMSASGVSLSSPVDINLKTPSVYNSFNDMSMKLDSAITQVNMTGIYVVALTTAVQALASAVGESFNIPGCGLDLAGMRNALFNGIMPPGVLELYSSVSAMNQKLQDLSLEGITAEMLGLNPPLTAENVVGQLKRNLVALAAMNIPPDLMSAALDPCGSLATMVLDQLNLPINVEQVDALELPSFRDLVHQIFENISSSSPPPVPPAPIGIEELPPITIIGPQP